MCLCMLQALFIYHFYAYNADSNNVNANGHLFPVVIKSNNYATTNANDNMLKNGSNKSKYYRNTSRTEENKTRAHVLKRASSKENDKALDGVNITDFIQPPVDFAILGFAKCGTTSLLQYFQNDHPETAMLPGEILTADHTRISERFQQLIHKRNNTSPLKLGIKNPSIHHNQVKMLFTKNYPPLKVIIGIRNPLFLFQSLYNYRAWEMCKRIPPNRQSSIVLKPTPNQIVKCGTTFRKDVSPHAPRYEFILMKLDKVDDISQIEANELNYFLKCTRQAYSGNINDYVIPNESKIFLYDITQLQDKNISRSNAFRKDMQIFFGLKNKIKEFPTKNSHAQFNIASNLQIDICDEKHDGAYNLLIKNANMTARWIIDKFILSEDVHVGNRDHFIELVESWVKNPCNK